MYMKLFGLHSYYFYEIRDREILFKYLNNYQNEIIRVSKFNGKQWFLASETKITLIFSFILPVWLHFCNIPPETYKRKNYVVILLKLLYKLIND